MPTKTPDEYMTNRLTMQTDDEQFPQTNVDECRMITYSRHRAENSRLFLKNFEKGGTGASVPSRLLSAS